MTGPSLADSADAQPPAARGGRPGGVVRRHSALHLAAAQLAGDAERPAARAPLALAVHEPAVGVAARVVRPAFPLADELLARAHRQSRGVIAEGVALRRRAGISRTATVATGNRPERACGMASAA